MTIRRKTIVTITTAFLVFMAVLYALSRTIIEGSAQIGGAGGL